MPKVLRSSFLLPGGQGCALAHREAAPALTALRLDWGPGEHGLFERPTGASRRARTPDPLPDGESGEGSEEERLRLGSRRIYKAKISVLDWNPVIGPSAEILIATRRPLNAMAAAFRPPPEEPPGTLMMEPAVNTSPVWLRIQETA